MDGEGSPSLFEGKNRISAILITLFLSCFAIAILFVFYRQFSGGLERPGVINPWRNTFARTLDQNKEPILWDVYIGAGKVEWEWDGFRPLSTAILDTMPTLPWTPKRWRGFSKEEEEETVHVSTIIVFPSQRKQKPGYVQGSGVEDYAIGITGVRCRGLTPNQ